MKHNLSLAFLMLTLGTTSVQAQKTAKKVQSSEVRDSERLHTFLADQKYWNVGDYAVVKGEKVKDGNRKKTSYGIMNTKTGNYVINPLNSKPKAGDEIIFHDEKSDYFYDYFLRLYEPPAGDPTGKPLVRWTPPYKWKLYNNSKGGGWYKLSSYEHDWINWYQINDQDQLERLKEVKLEGTSTRTSCYFIKRGGKVGVYILAWFEDHYSYDSNGLATGVVSQKCRIERIIPVMYDAIERKGSYYQAIKADGIDLYNAWNLKKAHPGLTKYDELDKYDKFRNIQRAVLNGKHGAVDDEGRVIIPLIYNSQKELTGPLNKHFHISYAEWYKNESAKYLDKKGEFEKTEHFEARLKDPKKQEEYLREIMADAPARYLKEKIPNKENLQLTLGEYDADKECFPILLDIAPWNIFMLPVPLVDAKEFKKEFDDIKAAAVKTVQIGIRYDAPAIEAITFTTHSGKVYK